MLFGVSSVGKKNMGGLGLTIHLALLGDVQAMPATAYDPNAATAEAVANYTGDITMKTGKYFVPFNLTYDMSGFDSPGQGETDGLSFKPTITLKMAGASSEVRAFLTANRHENLVAIATDKNGDKYLFGDFINPLKFDPSSKFGVGNAAADKRGAEVVLFTNSNNPAPGYVGAIPLAPTSGSGSTSTP